MYFRAVEELKATVFRAFSWSRVQTRLILTKQKICKRKEKNNNEANGSGQWLNSFFFFFCFTIIFIVGIFLYSHPLDLLSVSHLRMTEVFIIVCYLLLVPNNSYCNFRKNFTSIIMIEKKMREKRKIDEW